VSEEIWRVLICPVRTLITQDREEWRLRIKREPANLGLPEKWPLKWCVCVHAHVCACVDQYKRTDFEQHIPRIHG